jgi:hypothetical protein
MYNILMTSADGQSFVGYDKTKYGEYRNYLDKTF